MTARLKCPYCDKQFKELRGVSGHIRYKHKGESFIVKDIATALELPPSPDKRVWKPKTPKPCPKCDKTFKNWGNLQAHLESAHDVITDRDALRTLGKAIMKEAAATKKAVRTIGKVRDAVSTKPLKCPHCSKHFKNQLWLDRHAVAWHNVFMATPSKKSHLDLAIEEMQAEIATLENKADRLRDGLDVLISAREDLNRHAEN